MRFWLITVGEPVPLPGGRERLLRTGVLGGHLARAGHDVTWWTSTVDHFRKRFHSVPGPVLSVQPRYEVRFLSGRLYHHNLSLARLRNHREIARAFRATAATVPQPDLIVCSLPPLELCVEAVHFGRERGIPVFLDVRDPWPDVFYQVLPVPLRRLGPLLFIPFAPGRNGYARRLRGIPALGSHASASRTRAAGRGHHPRLSDAASGERVGSDRHTRVAGRPP